MIGIRRMKQLVAPLLPERAKTRFRARLFGYREPAVQLPLELSSSGSSRTVRVGSRVTLRYRDEDEADFRYHLTENGESIEELASFLELARGAGTLFDVGAWKGLFSLLFCLLDEHTRAVAFEPSPVGADAIVALANLNRCAARLEVRRAAAGQASGTGAARIAPDGIMTMDAVQPAVDVPSMPLAIVSLDDEVRASGVVPDLLKVDVEGYEYEVLAGATRLLRDRKPAICLELHLDLLERRGIGPGRVVSLLESYGYAFRTCAGQPLSPRQLSDSVHAIRRIVAV
jgi:FkbM family methyltransferase